MQILYNYLIYLIKCMIIFILFIIISFVNLSVVSTNNYYDFNILLSILRDNTLNSILVNIDCSQFIFLSFLSYYFLYFFLRNFKEKHIYIYIMYYKSNSLIKIIREKNMKELINFFIKLTCVIYLVSLILTSLLQIGLSFLNNAEVLSINFYTLIRIYQIPIFIYLLNLINNLCFSLNNFNKSHLNPFNLYVIRYTNLYTVFIRIIFITVNSYIQLGIFQIICLELILIGGIILYKYHYNKWGGNPMISFMEINKDKNRLGAMLDNTPTALVVAPLLFFDEKIQANIENGFRVFDLGALRDIPATYIDNRLTCVGVNKGKGIYEFGCKTHWGTRTDIPLPLPIVAKLNLTAYNELNRDYITSLATTSDEILWGRSCSIWNVKVDPNGEHYRAFIGKDFVASFSTLIYQCWDYISSTYYRRVTGILLLFRNEDLDETGFAFDPKFMSSIYTRLSSYPDRQVENVLDTLQKNFFFSINHMKDENSLDDLIIYSPIKFATPLIPNLTLYKSLRPSFLYNIPDYSYSSHKTLLLGWIPICDIETKNIVEDYVQWNSLALSYTAFYKTIVDWWQQGVETTFEIPSHIREVIDNFYKLFEDKLYMDLNRRNFRNYSFNPDCKIKFYSKGTTGILVNNGPASIGRDFNNYMTENQFIAFDKIREQSYNILNDKMTILFRPHSRLVYAFNRIDAMVEIQVYEFDQGKLLNYSLLKTQDQRICMGSDDIDATLTIWSNDSLFNLTKWSDVALLSRIVESLNVRLR